MTLRAMMQAGPAKVNDLFARLAETSDGAVKTREKLFAELKTELELHTSLEEEHLFPILRKNAETKELVAVAVRDNRELRAKLAELEPLPKNDETFAARLADLQKAFRQHARDEKKELLPAVQRALSADQVQVVAEKMEATVAEAEQARREEAEERRARARQEREQAEQEAAAEQEHEEAERRTREAARTVAAAAAKPAEIAAEAVDRMVGLATGQASSDDQAVPTSTPAPANPFFWPWLSAMQAMQPSRSSSSSIARAPASMEEVIPLGEEVLEVGKRTVNRGTARVRRYVVETPVEKEVTLGSERVVVERRKPVTDKVTGEVLTEVTIEVVETAEVPTVKKRTRVREELVVRVERSQRIETVRDTVRRDEIEVHQPGKRQLART